MFRGIIRPIARLLPIAALLAIASTHVAAIQRTGFDHLTTGFELRDAHRDMACEYCHVNGVFKGTPRTCEGCHMIGGRISATPKPPRHIASADNCALCHAGYNFAPIFRMDHTGARGSCASCHNNLTATGKSLKHIPSDNNCTACHTTVAFMPARMEHADLLQKDQCSGCHNGVRASAKTLHHVPTPASCNDCHTTLSWSPARFNHSGLLTNCQSCHNGITATGKVSNHIATPLDCSECHRYPSWSSLKVVRPPATERLAKEPPAGATERRPSDERGNPQRGLAKEPPAGATTPIAKPPAPGQHKASDSAFH
jgi:Cytochrome c7 and related cytochrome c